MHISKTKMKPVDVKYVDSSKLIIKALNLYCY